MEASGDRQAGRWRGGYPHGHTHTLTHTSSLSPAPGTGSVYLSGRVHGGGEVEWMGKRVG